MLWFKKIIVMLGGGTLEYLQKFLQCNEVEFTPSLLSFHPHPLIPGTVSTDIVFAFTYICINYLCHFYIFFLDVLIYSHVFNYHYCGLCIYGFQVIVELWFSWTLPLLWYLDNPQATSLSHFKSTKPESAGYS
jgi:hypothetical protein